MKSAIYTLVLLTVTSLLSCHKHIPEYNDLADYGYKGKISLISTKFYDDILESDGKWQIGAPIMTVNKYFNEDGNFTKRIVESRGLSFEVLYNYTKEIKKDWKRIDSGVISETGEITYDQNPGFTETTFDTTGVKKTQSIYVLNENHRPKTLEYKRYDENGSVTYNTLSTFEDKEGHLFKMTVQNKLTNTVDLYEYLILEKDRNDNPIRCLLKKNEKPHQIQISTITYE